MSYWDPKYDVQYSPVMTTLLTPALQIFSEVRTPNSEPSNSEKMLSYVRT
jgi:hypothetical protein